jgi:ABC-type Fe3+ transport system permease subunit
VTDDQRPPLQQTPSPAPVEEPPRPDQLRLIAGLLIVNLTLSILVTVLSLFARHSIVNYQLDHRHISDPRIRERLRDSYVYAIVTRAVGNAVASVIYVFLVRALFRGRRWAYRRVIWLGSAGGLALLLAQTTPYPPWLRVEQLTQAVVLGLLVYVVTRPAVRAHFAPGLPGRDTRRFRK